MPLNIFIFCKANKIGNEISVFVVLLPTLLSLGELDVQVYGPPHSNLNHHHQGRGGFLCSTFVHHFIYAPLLYIILFLQLFSNVFTRYVVKYFLDNGPRLYSYSSNPPSFLFNVNSLTILEWLHIC